MIDDESPIKDLVATVFRIDLAEAKYFRIRQRSSQAFAQGFQVSHFFLIQRQSFLTIVGGDVCDLFYGFRRMFYRK